MSYKEQNIPQKKYFVCRTFCPVGRFACRTFCPVGSFVCRMFCPEGSFVVKRFVYRTLCPVGRFVRRAFCLCTLMYAFTCCYLFPVHFKQILATCFLSLGCTKFTRELHAEAPQVTTIIKHIITYLLLFYFYNYKIGTL